MPKELTLDQQQQVLVNAFILKSTVPLLFDESADPPSILGTGTLFTSEGRCFIVTAAHILKKDENDLASDDVDLTKIVYPSQMQAAKLLTLGSFDVYRHPSDKNVDIAVLELKDNATVNTLARGWAFLDFSVLKGVEPQGKFIISGFLHEGAHMRDNDVMQSALNLRTDPLHFTPAVRSPNLDYDRFYYLTDKGEGLDGTLKDIPSLKGMSGSSIWFCRDISTSEYWAPSKALSIVGIQSSQKQKEWVRGVDWRAAAEIFNSSEVNLSYPPG